MPLTTRRRFISQISLLGSLALFEQCKFISKPLVYFIGDSLTKGIGTSDVTRSYPYQTAKLLNHIDFEVFGYSGMSAAEYYNQRRYNLIVSSMKPVFAVVFFGANDLNQFPTKKVYNDLVVLHQYLNQRGVKTIAMPVLNRKDKFAIQPEFNNNRLALNELLKANYHTFASGFVSPDTAKEIYSSDAPDNIKYFNRHDVDGLTAIHLTNDGAAVLANAVANELRRVIASF